MVEIVISSVEQWKQRAVCRLKLCLQGFQYTF